MSFIVGFVISDDCSEEIFDSFRDIYGISFEKLTNVSLKNQLEHNQSFYFLNDVSKAYFWDRWTPIGSSQELDLWTNMLNGECEWNIVSRWELEFNLIYISFEAQMYILIIRYLKDICGVNNVGLVGTMLNGDYRNYQFPQFDTVSILQKICVRKHYII